MGFIDKEYLKIQLVKFLQCNVYQTFEWCWCGAHNIQYIGNTDGQGSMNDPLSSISYEMTCSLELEIANIAIWKMIRSFWSMSSKLRSSSLEYGMK